MYYSRRSLSLNDYNSPKELISALENAHNNVEKNADNKVLSAFFNYLAEKHQVLLGADIKNYQSKREILKLFPPILLAKDWQYLYRFIANLVPDRPSGGYFIRVKNRLDEKKVQNLQFICNFVYGKLALSELGLFREEFNKAFEELVSKGIYETVDF